MPSFFSKLKSAAKAVAQAFRKPKAAPPKAASPKAASPKAAPPKQKRTKAERVTRLQEITLNKNREAANAFYAATVGLWNVPEGKDEETRNRLIIEKLGVSDLKDAFDIVMNRYNEIMQNKADEDLDYDPIVLTQLQTELAGRVRGQNELTS